jgi:dTMP kinase
MKREGKFITFEGGEGVGKSTQALLLAKKLNEIGVKVRATREPGGDEIGEKIRKILKDSGGMDPVCEVLLLFAARRDHFIKLILPLIERGYFVVCDRFYDSSLVYQGILKNVSIEHIMRLKQIAVGDFEPDLTILLDLDADVAMQRVRARNPSGDEYDRMDRREYGRIREGYGKTADIFSFRTVSVNAEGSEEKVFSRVWKTFRNKIPLPDGIIGS